MLNPAGIDYLQDRANKAVTRELTRVREDEQEGILDDYNLGRALGRISVFHGEMGAEEWLVEGVRNEVWFLWRRALNRKRGLTEGGQ
jgi:hypothetical protein